MIWYVWLICVRRMLLRCFLSGGDSESSARVRRHTVLGCVELEGCEIARPSVGVMSRSVCEMGVCLGRCSGRLLDLQMWLHRRTALADFFHNVQRPFRGVSATRRTSFYISVFDDSRKTVKQRTAPEQ